MEEGGMMLCPKCGNPDTYRESADVGVGVIYGPYGCPECGWSEWPQYDRSEGPSPEQKDNPEWYVDQWGGMQRVEAIVERCERFGLDGDVVREAFKVDGPDTEVK
jgi:hypothetical protein